ncbi:MAG: hypothetical protein WDZ35_14535 [Crocinitomicaceae bacterium]
MEKTVFFCLLLFSLNSFGQGGADSLLQGRWELFEIIDNMTGEAMEPSHKSSEDYVYYIEFNDNLVKYNLEINTCTNEVVVDQNHHIEFKYFSECTKICCDDDFSKLLTYSDVNTYYIKSNTILILVSEDRIFYFRKTTSPQDKRREKKNKK